VPKGPFDRDRCERLAEQQWVAREIILDLLPPEVAQLMKSADCGSREEVYDWVRVVTDKLLHLADVRAGSEMGDMPFVERAYCPACGGSTSSAYHQGFTVPGGLLKHLRGEQNAHECSVMRFFRVMELDHVSDPSWLDMRGRMKAANEAARSNKASKKPR
jgi:hypothetical protein